VNTKRGNRGKAVIAFTIPRKSRIAIYLTSIEVSLTSLGQVTCRVRAVFFSNIISPAKLYIAASLRLFYLIVRQGYITELKLPIIVSLADPTSLVDILNGSGECWWTSVWLKYD
jgi:hypothetical protein